MTSARLRGHRRARPLQLQSGRSRRGARPRPRPGCRHHGHVLRVRPRSGHDAGSRARRDTVPASPLRLARASDGRGRAAGRRVDRHTGTWRSERRSWRLPRRQGHPAGAPDAGHQTEPPVHDADRQPRQGCVPAAGSRRDGRRARAKAAELRAARGLGTPIDARVSRHGRPEHRGESPVRACDATLLRRRLRGGVRHSLR